MKKIGIYIHIPFCKQKCAYCDFTSFSNKQNLIPNYIKILEQEIKECKLNKKDYKIETIYFGGRDSIFYR